MKTDTLTSSFLDLRAKLRHIALRLLRNDEDAEDALQDTWLKLRSAGDIESSFAARNKLVAVLRNLCIDKMRAAKQFIPIDETNVAESLQYSPNPESINELEKLLQKGLTPLQLRIFQLITHEAMEYEEIAKALDMSVEAVRMNMCRARRKIRETYNALSK